MSTSVRDPFPGWHDQMGGIYGLTNAIGFGLLRVAYSRPDFYIDFIPVDATVNAMIVASWKKYKEQVFNN